MSNFPISYRLSWLPRLLKPSLAGDDGSFGPLEARWSEPRIAVRLVFLGDISAVANSEPPEIEPALRKLIAAADLVVANCESPVVARPGFPLGSRLGVRHAMTPAFLDGLLAAAVIAPERLVMSLANNHALDQGGAGFEETVATLAERGIRTVGTGAGGLVRRVEAGGLGIGFLAFTQWRNRGSAEFAGRVTMAHDIAGWRTQVGSADIICAVPHWDFEARHFPGMATRALARRLAGEGASLIVGGHAHVVQPVENVEGALIAYALGDFLGTVWRRTTWPLRIGALLAVEVSADMETRGKITAYRVAPFIRERQGLHERLCLVEPDADASKRRVRRRLGTIFASSGGQKPEKSL